MSHLSVFIQRQASIQSNMTLMICQDYLIPFSVLDETLVATNNVDSAQTGLRHPQQKPTVCAGNPTAVSRQCDNCEEWYHCKCVAVDPPTDRVLFHGRTTHLATEALLPPGLVFGTASQYTCATKTSVITVFSVNSKRFGFNVATGVQCDIPINWI